MTPDEARRRILLALKRFEDDRAAEAKKLDGRKVIPMDEWREKLDEIEEAAGKATARPWALEGDDEGEPHLVGYGFALPLTDAGLGDEDAEYAILAANNADRLARFVQTLSWALETSLKRDGSSEVEIAHLLDDWWKESEK